MVAERIRNRTRVAMLCYAMLWMDPAFRTNRHICLIYLPQLSNFPLPACAACPAWPMQTRCPIYYLPPSLPYQSSFHSASLSLQPAKEASNRVHAICPSAIDRSLISFLILGSEKPRGHGWGKNMVRHEDSLSLSPCVRPCKGFPPFLSFPSVRAYLGGHVRFRLYCTLLESMI